MKVTLKKKEDQITQRLNGLLDRSQSVQSFLRRNIFKMYQDAQRQRWESKNLTEGEEWDALNKDYAQYKKIKFAAYPGSGQKMMIATGALYQATIDEPNVIATNTSLKVSVDVSKAEHAPYANEKRPFMRFSDSTVDKMKQKLMDYLKGK